MSNDVVDKISKKSTNVVREYYQYLGGPLHAMCLRDLGILYGECDSLIENMKKFKELIRERMVDIASKEEMK